MIITLSLDLMREKDFCPSLELVVILARELLDVDTPAVNFVMNEIPPAKRKLSGGSVNRKECFNASHARQRTQRQSELI